MSNSCVDVTLDLGPLRKVLELKEEEENPVEPDPALDAKEIEKIEKEMLSTHEHCAPAERETWASFFLNFGLESVANFYMQEETRREALAYKRSGDELSTAELIDLLNDDDDRK